ncbi:MAG: single-stranded DNA-binding protein [Clostridia bacterium]|nr:single-stranded DNA-binding protein [Clostridia bacterium]
MLNTAVLMGRLTADPELKRTANSSVTNFTLAVSRSYVRAGQERQTDFIDIVAWGRTAEMVCRYFTKGQMMAVQGRIETRTYEDKNGMKRKVFEVIADNVHFADSKRDGSSSAPSNGNSQSQAPSYSNASFTDFQEMTDSDDDLPF